MPPSMSGSPLSTRRHRRDSDAARSTAMLSTVALSQQEKRELLSWEGTESHALCGVTSFTNSDANRAHAIMEDERDRMRETHKAKVARESQLVETRKQAAEEEFKQRQKERAALVQKQAEEDKKSAGLSHKYYAGIGRASEGTAGMFNPSTNQSPGGFRDPFVSPGGTRSRRSSFSTAALTAAETQSSTSAPLGQRPPPPGYM